MKLLKLCQKLAAELLAKDPDGEKELFAAFAQLSILGQAGTGNDAMDMGMKIQLLSPGMKDLDDTRGGTEIFFVRG